MSDRQSVISSLNARSSQKCCGGTPNKDAVAAEVAALKVKMKYVEVETKKKLELEKLEVQKELDMAEARLSILSHAGEGDTLLYGKDIIIDNVPEKQNVHDYVQDYVNKNPLLPTKTPMETPIIPVADRKKMTSNYGPKDSTRLDASAPEFVPHQTTQTESTAELANITKVFADQINLSRLPTPEPGVFCGDPLTYPAWKGAFETLIERRCIPPGERIYYLKRYLTGAARDCVEGFILLNTDAAFEKAKKLLDKRFGNPFVVANAFRNKLEAWPKIDGRDGLALQKLTDFLSQCVVAMDSINSLNVWNDERENRKILNKLPDWITYRWGRIVAHWRRTKSAFPPFREFVKFLEDEADIACDPVTSSKPRIQRKPDYEKPDGNRFQFKRSNFSTGATSYVKCVFCSKEHDIENCKGFSEITLSERKNIALEKGMCFGCLKVGHRSRECPKRSKCKICARYHPTSFHGDYIPRNSAPREPASTSTGRSAPQKPVIVHASGQSGTTDKCSMIVPVRLSHRDNPQIEKLVYALLDTQSDTTFVLKQTIDALNVTGPSVQLKLSTMSAKDELIQSNKISGLIVRGCNLSTQIPLPACYSRDIMPANRDHIPTPDKVKDWPHLSGLESELIPLCDVEVGLLIGYNCPQALTPRQVISSANGNTPYGQLTDLGWGVVGIIDQDVIQNCDAIGFSHHVMTCEIPQELQRSSADGSHVGEVYFSMKNSVHEVITPKDVAVMMELDFNDHKSPDIPISHDDNRFLKTLTAGIHQRTDKHYEMPLPFKEKEPNLPNNRTATMKRLMQLKQRFGKNPRYESDYCGFMRNMIDKGHMEKIPVYDVNDGWYIPHHGVYNSLKPGKIRVVFDCSAKSKGASLNDHLLKGPDLTNTMTGVLCRFRKEHIAIQCDVEGMFHQFHVNEEHRKYIRLLWWEDDKTDCEPSDYRMTVHLFGATSSPGCANFAFRQLATDFEHVHGSEAADFVRNSFYVDDGLTSVGTVDEAVNLIQKSKDLCREGALKLHKFASNSKEVLMSIPPEDCAKGISDVDLMCDSLPVERTLGVNWCIESDTFGFKLNLRDQPFVRRGILSTINSIYDPLGFIAPVLLLGKEILQETCKDQLDWDDPLPDEIRARWEKWRQQLWQLNDIQISRCFKPPDFTNLKSVELHHFSDASSSGYGQSSYLRFVDEENRVHCSFVMGKARIAPLKSVTIPRLELTAAVVSVRISEFLGRELRYDDITEFFWTDSKIVLGYIANDSKRFHIFVANRVQYIREHTQPSQWRYVQSMNNPADIASRGISASNLSESTWLTGPDFLWKESILSDEDDEIKQISVNDPEVRKVKVHVVTKTRETFDLGRMEHISKWNRAKKAIAICLKLKTKLLNKLSMCDKNKCEDRSLLDNIDVSDLQRAELEIIKLVQRESFENELSVLQSSSELGDHAKCADDECDDRKVLQSRKRFLKVSTNLSRLDPYIDTEGVLRVGGRIKNSDLPFKFKHPIILPRKHHVTDMIVRHFHEKIGHQGRGMTVAEIRSNGLWIVGCSSTVSHLISKCVTCRKLRCSTLGQKMADLPEDRTQEAPPFTYCGVDMFGPFIVKEGRKELKRYGALFTCLGCRAIHIETTNSMSTDSFINALRRFIAVRGPIRQLRSDQGTNFVGARNELYETDSKLVSDFLRQENCDYFPFVMNVPSASHMGGIWERQIRTVRSVISSLMNQASGQLDDEGLRTLMCEVMAIVNSRPLTVDNLNDPTSLEPLTPNHLLTSKSKVILPPPGNFQKADTYSRKMWRRVQHLSNEFWQRWKREYLQTLQVRQKWKRPCRVAHVGDIALLKEDDRPRNMWRLCRISEVFKSRDNLIRKVKIVIGDPSLSSDGKRVNNLTYLERPIHKLVLLLESELEVP